jgi:hypothetical protein
MGMSGCMEIPGVPKGFVEFLLALLRESSRFAPGSLETYQSLYFVALVDPRIYRFKNIFP